MASDPIREATSAPVPAERTADEGGGLDRIVTAIAFLATVLLILLSPLGG